MKRLLSTIFICTMAFASTQCGQQKVATTSSGGLQSIYYDFDQSFIRSDSVPVMQGNANYLKSNSSSSVTVEGNCDARGTNEYNLALG